MNWNQIVGQWSQFKRKVKGKLGELPDNKSEIIQCKKDIPVEKLREGYGGISKNEDEKQLADFQVPPSQHTI